MRTSISGILNSRNVFRLAMLAAVLCLMGAVPLLSGAQTQATLKIVNNSSWEIRHLYLSPVDNDDWGSDQLNSVIISPGESATINIPSDQSQIKVISEDADGCFLYNTVGTTGASVWTITSDATPNCGG
jgi:hypothetical protein